MLLEISKYNYLGRFDEICYILKYILSDTEINIYDIKSYCLHNCQYININVEGILSFLKFSEIIEEKDNKVILTIRGKDIINKAKNDQEICTELVKQVLHMFKNNSEEPFIDFNKIKYDIKDGPYISSSSIPLKYSGLRNLMLDLGFFYINPINKDVLIFNSTYSDLLRDYIQGVKKRISLEALKKILEKQELLGLKAEIFVMGYEQKRLKDDKRNGNIVHISPFDVNAGYDIASFHNEYSIQHDRFIEVKSFNNNLNFYWSKNEIEVAKLKQDLYYLYLVDRDKIHQEDYEPIIIKNPYVSVFLNDLWFKEAQSWFFKKY